MTAPCDHDRERSGTDSSAWNAPRDPSPSQAGQAPCGLLKLKLRGSISGRLVPQAGHARWTLSSRSSQPAGDGGVGGDSTRASTRPSASFSARSRLSASRGRMPSRITSRSITASIVCGLRLDQLGRRVGDLDHLAVNPAQDQPGAPDRLEDVEVLPLAVADQRGQELDLPARRQGHQLVGHLLGGLAADRRVALRAMRRAGPGEQQSEVVVDLGDRAERAPRAGRAGLLVDRDRRRQALDRVDVRPLELVEELPGVGREAFEVAPLPLGVDRVEGQRALPRPADPGQDDQPVARQVDVDIPQVVHPRAADLDRRGRWMAGLLRNASSRSSWLGSFARVA